MHEPVILPDTLENRTLRENVHPASWQNPRPAGRYHLVVIGGGTAGLVTAAGAASLGARVALVERQLLGGDCLNVGCVPSKALIRSARAVHDARSAAGFGAAGSETVATDFGRIMERMRRLRATISPHDSARRFRDELGVDVFFGQGCFDSPASLLVGDALLRFKRAAVCTGARAGLLPIPGLAEAGCLTNETLFSLTELPKRLCIIGGGPIGCEMAQAFARFGSQVTLLEGAATIMGREDPDAVAIIRHALRRDGVDIREQVQITGIERREELRVVQFEHNGLRQVVLADQILLGVGRFPNVEGMGLEEAGVAFDTRQGIKVDNCLRTTNRRIFAAGDVCSPFRFTHTADAMARMVVANALFPLRQKASSLVIPWCTYTDPEVAHVGLYEAEARAKGVETETITVPLADVDRALLDGEKEGFARVHLRKGSDRILGATIVARHAGDMAGELCLAMTNGLGLSDIGRTIHPYPTQGEVTRKLADAWNRSRLTPRAKKMLDLWFRFR
jgi:pyruvate/2-oxoglutarate dehydrogenase complex dihydrolipoamide dehydrogenase (E3) component